MVKIVTRKQARELGLKRYFTGRSCKNGHVSERYSSGQNCVDCAEVNKRRWRKANPDKELSSRRRYGKVRRSDPAYRSWQAAYNKAWRGNNPDKVDSHNKSYYAANRAKVIAKAVSADAANPIKKLERNRSWRSKYPDKCAALARNYRARKKGNGGKHTVQDVLDILNAQGHKCAYFDHCGTVLTCDNKQVDHIVPLAAGGSNGPENLQILCIACNQSKGSKDPIDHLRSIGLLVMVN
jgi:5-methylcytosine-specific restriction endonuclease McrA